MKMSKCGWKTECGGCSCRLYTREEGKFGMLVWTLKNGYIKSPMCWITSVFKTTALPSESNTQSLSKHTRSFTGTARLYVTSMFEPCVLHTFSWTYLVFIYTHLPDSAALRVQLTLILFPPGCVHEELHHPTSSVITIETCSSSPQPKQQPLDRVLPADNMSETILVTSQITMNHSKGVHSHRNMQKVPALFSDGRPLLILVHSDIVLKIETA